MSSQSDADRESDAGGDSDAGADPDSGRADGGATEEQEWRFGVDDVGEDATPQQPPLEPESVSVENAFFVAVGVLFTLAVVAIAVLP
jgi:hypothetical protein